MIEAVNSTLSNAPLLRASVEHTDASRLAANPARAQESAPPPQAPYISPYIFLDVNLDKAVLQFRDGDTGDVLSQYPSETALRVQISQSRVEPEDTQASRSGSAVSSAQAQVATTALASAAQASREQTSTTFVTTA